MQWPSGAGDRRQLLLAQARGLWGPGECPRTLKSTALHRGLSLLLPLPASDQYLPRPPGPSPPLGLSRHRSPPRPPPHQRRYRVAQPPGQCTKAQFAASNRHTNSPEAPSTGRGRRLTVTGRVEIRPPPSAHSCLPHVLAAGGSGLSSLTTTDNNASYSHVVANMTYNHVLYSSINDNTMGSHET